MTDILVSNIPKWTTKEALRQAFTRYKDVDDDGEGDENKIKYILYPLDDDLSMALISFTHCADDLLRRTTRISNGTLSIKRAPQQMYNQCAAEVDELVIAGLPDVQACIKELSHEYGVTTDLSDETGRLTLHGSLSQLRSAQARLAEIHEQECEFQRVQLREIERKRHISHPTSDELETEALLRRICRSSETTLPGTARGSQHSALTTSAAVDDSICRRDHITAASRSYMNDTESSAAKRVEATRPTSRLSSSMADFNSREIANYLLGVTSVSRNTVCSDFSTVPSQRDWRNQLPAHSSTGLNYYSRDSVRPYVSLGTDRNNATHGEPVSSVPDRFSTTEKNFTVSATDNRYLRNRVESQGRPLYGQQSEKYPSRAADTGPGGIDHLTKPTTDVQERLDRRDIVSRNSYSDIGSKAAYRGSSEADGLIMKTKSTDLHERSRQSENLASTSCRVYPETSILSRKQPMDIDRDRDFITQFRPDKTQKYSTTQSLSTTDRQIGTPADNGFTDSRDINGSNVQVHQSLSERDNARKDITLQSSLRSDDQTAGYGKPVPSGAERYIEVKDRTATDTVSCYKSCVDIQIGPTTTTSVQHESEHTKWVKDALNSAKSAPLQSGLEIRSSIEKSLCVGRTTASGLATGAAFVSRDKSDSASLPAVWTEQLSAAGNIRGRGIDMNLMDGSARRRGLDLHGTDELTDKKGRSSHHGQSSATKLPPPGRYDDSFLLDKDLNDNSLQSLPYRLGQVSVRSHHHRHASSDDAADDVHLASNIAIPETRHATTASDESWKPNEKTSIDLDFFVITYILQVLEGKVRDISRKFDVHIRTKDRLGDDLLTVIFDLRLIGTREQEMRAREAFVELYEETFRDIVMRTIEVDDASLISLVAEELTSMRDKYSDSLVIITEEPETMIFVGLLDAVTRAHTHLKRKLSSARRASADLDIQSQSSSCAARKESKDAESSVSKEENSKRSELSVKSDTSSVPKTDFLNCKAGDQFKDGDSDYCDVEKSTAAQQHVSSTRVERGVEAERTKRKMQNTESQKMNAASGNRNSVVMAKEKHQRIEQISTSGSTGDSVHRSEAEILCNPSSTFDISTLQHAGSQTGASLLIYNEREYEQRSNRMKDYSCALPPMEATVFHCGFENRVSVGVCVADITRVEVDAVMNAANGNLDNIAGVAGAIEDLAGSEFGAECRKYVLIHGRLRTGDVIHTRASGGLVCKNVIHAVGPIWGVYLDKEECARVLQKTFFDALIYADRQLEAVSLALPAIGTGFFGVPLDVCARAMFYAICSFATQTTAFSPLRRILVVDNNQETGDTIRVIFEQLQEVDGQENKTKSTSSAEAATLEVSRHRSQVDDLFRSTARSELTSDWNSQTCSRQPHSDVSSSSDIEVANALATLSITEGTGADTGGRRRMLDSENGGISLQRSAARMLTDVHSVPVNVGPRSIAVDKNTEIDMGNTQVGDRNAVNDRGKGTIRSSLAINGGRQITSDAIGNRGRSSRQREGAGGEDSVRRRKRDMEETEVKVRIGSSGHHHYQVREHVDLKKLENNEYSFRPIGPRDNFSDEESN